MTRSGHVHCDGEELFVGTALGRELVGLRPVDAIRYEVYFGPVVLGLVDPTRGKLRLIRVRKPRPKLRRPPVRASDIKMAAASLRRPRRS